MLDFPFANSITINERKNFDSYMKVLWLWRSKKPWCCGRSDRRQLQRRRGRRRLRRERKTSYCALPRMRRGGRKSGEVYVAFPERNMIAWCFYNLFFYFFIWKTLLDVKTKKKTGNWGNADRQKDEIDGGFFHRLFFLSLYLYTHTAVIWWERFFCTFEWKSLSLSLSLLWGFYFPLGTSINASLSPQTESNVGLSISSCRREGTRL